MNDLQHYYDFAVNTAWDAGRLTMGYFQAGVRAEFKADDTPVTIADRNAEQLIRDRITAAFPDHAIVGEEFGNSGDPDATHKWYIDPIDGTKSFMRGVPIYSTLLALEINGEVEVGVQVMPALNEIVSAATGMGCWWNGRRAHVSTETDLSRSVVSHIDTASFALYGDKAASWDRLNKASYYNAGWCDSYGYALVATGRVEVMLDPIVSVWDVAPLLPIIREAGGYFGDWHGNETIHTDEALATNRALLPEVLALLKGE